MKKIIIILLLIPFLLSAQNHISIGVSNGYMINADKGLFKMGLGGSISYLIANYIKMGSCNNYVTLSIEGINYPHTEENYTFSNFNDGVNNAFHYVKILLGYRIGLRTPDSAGNYFSYRNWNREEGLSFEPTIGIGIHNIYFNNNIILISPRINYVRNNIQMSLYSDYGQSKYHNRVGYSTIWSIGVLMGLLI